MAREERIVLTDILETLKEILNVQKEILNNSIETKTKIKDPRDISKQEKELLKGQSLFINRRNDMNTIDDDFKEKVATELFNISYDLNIIRKALLSISDDIQLNMSYCDVLSIVLEENGLATRDEIDSMVLDLNDKRTKKTKKVMNKVSKKLKVVANEQKVLMDILKNSPLKGEA